MEGEEEKLKAGVVMAESIPAEEVKVGVEVVKVGAGVASKLVEEEKAGVVVESKLVEEVKVGAEVASKLVEEVKAAVEVEERKLAVEARVGAVGKIKLEVVNKPVVKAQALAEKAVVEKVMWEQTAYI